MTEMMDLYGIGDHGGGPTRAILDQGVHWADPRAAARHPKMPIRTASRRPSSRVEKRCRPRQSGVELPVHREGLHSASGWSHGKVSIPTWKSELYFEYHRGVMTTQANHKRNMRESSIWTLNAEKWASLAWLDGDKYPADELTEDWKKVLFNQFHDLAAGSGIGIIYKDAQKDYDVVHWSTNEISAASASNR